MNETNEKLIALLRELIREEVRQQLAEYQMAQPPVLDEVMLTAAEVARIKRVTKGTVYEWARKKLIRHERTPTGKLRFRRADIDKFEFEGK